MRSDTIKRGPERAPHRSLLRATGVGDDDFRKAFIAVCNSHVDILPGHVHLNEVGQYVNFTLPVILMALAKWALDKVAPGAMLPELSPCCRRGNSDPWLWSSVRRWLKRRRVLFPQVDVPDHPSMRETAAALVAAMVARMNPAPAYATASAAWQSALGP